MFLTNKKQLYTLKNVRIKIRYTSKQQALATLDFPSVRSHTKSIKHTVTDKNLIMMA